MQDYLVRYRGIARDANELDAALVRLRDFESSPHALRACWLHGYAMRETDGGFGLACAFQAEDAGTLALHAAATRLRAAEILPVVGTRVVRRFAPTMVYLVRRRAAWRDSLELERALEEARRVAEEERPGRVVWLRSYAVREDDGSIGSWCLYQAVDPQALHRHAERAGLPANAITPVIGRIVCREDGDRSAAGDAAAARSALH